MLSSNPAIDCGQAISGFMQGLGGGNDGEAPLLKTGSCRDSQRIARDRRGTSWDGGHLTVAGSVVAAVSSRTSALIRYRRGRLEDTLGQISKKVFPTTCRICYSLSHHSRHHATDSCLKREVL
jgi:hypothetical protein